jgi:high-affinity nickel permease
LIKKSATEIGYLSFGVAQLRFLKSIHIHIFPVFFSTGMMLETQST